MPADLDVLPVPGMAIALEGDAVAQGRFELRGAPEDLELSAGEAVLVFGPPPVAVSCPGVLDVLAIPLHDPLRVVSHTDGEHVLAQEHAAEGHAHGARGAHRAVEALDPHEVGAVRAGLLQNPMRTRDQRVTPPAVSAGEVGVPRPAVVEARAHRRRFHLTNHIAIQVAVVAFQRSAGGRVSIIALGSARAAVLDEVAFLAGLVGVSNVGSCAGCLAGEGRGA
mmetsp:Transcript_105649/g.251940  ORF Transcript_105649/g.251940 Transcript_105649/m.251940 type:complete len:223 (+) Transcript_105649:1134-1802(+)